MKNILILLTVGILLISCGRDSYNNVEQEKKKTTIFEGTVSSIGNMIIGTAYADEYPRCLMKEDDRVYDFLECFPQRNNQCKGESGERCIFLLDSRNLFIANAIVKSGKYTFNFEGELSKDKKYTLIVEDFDDKSFYRETIIINEEIKKSVEVSPFTTLLVEFKKQLLDDVDDLDYFSEAMGNAKQKLISIPREQFDSLLGNLKNNKYLLLEFKRMLLDDEENSEVLSILAPILFGDVIETYTSSSKNIQQEFRSLRYKYSSIREKLLSIEDMTYKTKKGYDVYMAKAETSIFSVREELNKFDTEMVSLNREKEVLAHELTHVVQQRERARYLLSKISPLIEQKNKTEDRELIMELNNKILTEVDNFKKENEKDEGLFSLFPDEWDIDTRQSFVEEIEARVDRIEMAIILNYEDINDINSNISELKSILRDVDIERNIFKQEFGQTMRRLDDSRIVAQGTMGTLLRQMEKLSSILSERKESYMLGLGSSSNINGLDLSYSRITIKNKNGFELKLINNEELVDSFFVTKIEIINDVYSEELDSKSFKKSSIAGADIILYFGEMILLRVRRRPDLLTQEWDAIIDSNVEVMIDNPLYNDPNHQAVNILFEEGVDRFIQDIDGISIEFSEKIDPCYCTRG